MNIDSESESDDSDQLKDGVVREECGTGHVYEDLVDKIVNPQVRKVFEKKHNICVLEISDGKGILR